MPIPNIRIPIAKPGHSLKSKRDYDRRNNKYAVEVEAEDLCCGCDDCIKNNCPVWGYKWKN